MMLTVVGHKDRFMIDSPCPERQQSAGVFPVLPSETYSEVIDDTVSLVKALRENRDLQKEFLSILQQPHRDLLGLTNELYAIKSRMEENGEREVESEKYSGLVAQLSTHSPVCAHNEILALITATNTFRELSPLSLNCIINATREEIDNLFLLFTHIPLSSSAHNFSKPTFSETDPVFCQLLSRIGFINWRGFLVYEIARGFCGLDMVTLTIIAIHSVTRHHT